MTPTSAPSVLPSPISVFRGRFDVAWGLARTGRLRRAAGELAGHDPARLSSEDRVRQLSLLMSCRLAIGDISSASLTGHELTVRSAEDDEALDPAVVTLAELALGELASALGSYDEALAHFYAAGATMYADDADLAPWRAGAVTALVRLGRRTEAMQLAHEQMAQAEESASPHRIALALRTLATTDPELDAVATLTRALGLADHSNDLRLVAQIKADLGGLLLFMPDGGEFDACILLREAEAFASAEGLWPLHTRIARLLDRVGEAPTPLGEEAIAGLTNAEQRVARLAAQGLSNRQIADQLAVTIKGVEWHLSRVYRKLGIESRSGLSQLLQSNAARPA